MVSVYTVVFASAIVAAEVLETDGTVNVDFTHYACGAYVPPVWILGLLLDMCTCLGEGCPR